MPIALERSVTDALKGCLVTQANKPLALGVALTSANQVSSLTAVAVTSILSSPNHILNGFIITNRYRLGRSYAIISDFMRFHNIEYLPANSGLYVWARLTSEICTEEEEICFVMKAMDQGVSISAGSEYHSKEAGWFRVVFSLPSPILLEGLRRIETALGLRGWPANEHTPQQAENDNCSP